MQKLKLTRKYRHYEATIGTLFLNDKEICKTLENPWLLNAPFLSCIPEGTYAAKKYNSTKYPDVWELQDVKGRTLILIHIGNRVRDTSGCILVGEYWGFYRDELAVLKSGDTLRMLRKKLDDEFTIEIKEIKEAKT